MPNQLHFHATRGLHLGPVTSSSIADYVCRGSTRAGSDMAPFLPDSRPTVETPEENTP